MPRSLRLSQRVFLANAAVLTFAATALALSPATVSFPISPDEALVLGVGLIAMLFIDLVVLGRAFAPLERLVAVMQRVDPLEPGRRLPADQRSPELVAVAASFNAMLERLEHERRDSARRALGAQEAERRRISRELHDEVGQTLTAVLLRLDHAGGDDDGLDPIVEHIRGALEEIRRIATGLRPVVLDELGLPTALRTLSGDVADCAGLPIAMNVPDELPPLDADAELVVYRVAQEALTNVTRHARARAASLSLAAEGGSARLIVADDGRGRAGAPEGSGIRGMRERALLLGGQLELGDAPGGGTRLALTIPLEELAA